MGGLGHMDPHWSHSSSTGNPKPSTLKCLTSHSAGSDNPTIVRLGVTLAYNTLDPIKIVTI
jgi:hypothetical protein